MTTDPTDQEPQPDLEGLIKRLKDTLGGALLAEQKAENAFAPEGKILNRRAIHAAVKMAWKAYNDCVEQVADALQGVSERRPTQESREGWKPTHRHVKRGTDYQVIGTASLQAGEPIGEAASLVIYKDAKGRLWARPEVEVDDGRFEPLAASPTAQEAQAAPEPGPSEDQQGRRG